MPRASDPTDPLRRKAAAFPAVAKGTVLKESYELTCPSKASKS
jgi:hypothetical protein